MVLLFDLMNAKIVKPIGKPEVMLNLYQFFILTRFCNDDATSFESWGLTKAPKTSFCHLEASSWVQYVHERGQNKIMLPVLNGLVSHHQAAAPYFGGRRSQPKSRTRKQSVPKLAKLGTGIDRDPHGIILRQV